MSPFDVSEAHLADLMDAAAMNSFIKFDRQDVPFSQRTILGDATEAGLARFVDKTVSNYDEHQQKYKKVFDVPFNSANKWALVIASLIVSMKKAAAEPFDRSTNHTLRVTWCHISRAHRRGYFRNARRT